MKIDSYIKFILSVALLEDLGQYGCDITTNLLIDPDSMSKAVILAKAQGVIAGVNIAKEVFLIVDKDINFKQKVNDGDHVKSGAIIAEISGKSRSILVGERVALNFLQHLSGIASLTNKFVMAIKPSKTKILDTRKTSPCLRVFEKYAVKVGGGFNHRFGLFDGILVKGNHIKAVSSEFSAISEIVSKFSGQGEIEVKTIKEAKQAADSNAQIILLDNMSIAEMKKCVAIIRKINKKIQIEASGGISFKNVKNVAKTGVDRISVGALTHSAPAMDISLKIL